MTLPTLTVSIGRGGWLLGSATKSILGTTTYLGYATFSDITSKVREVHIRRGRQHELDRVEAGKATVVLMNQDGVFDPMNTSSPYYPDIRPMVPLRIQATLVGPPASIAGLVGWYDFSDITTLFQDSARTSPVTANNDPIGGVTDKSGSGNHIVQATAGNRPLYNTAVLNSQSVLTCVSTDTLATATFPVVTSSTMFLVGRFTTAGNHGWLSTYTVVNQGYQMRSSAATTSLSAYDGSQHLQTAGSQATNVWATMHWAHGGGNFKPYLDGVAGTTAAVNAQSTSTAAFRLGALEDGTTFNLTGQIAEVIIFNTALTAADQNLVGNYLAAKWGLSWTAVT